jgi:hypothetical protein
VWNDEDADGIQDTDEEGINDVEVILYDSSNGEALDTTYTVQDPNNAAVQGYYMFEGLFPGDYYVEFVMPTGYFITDPGQTTDDKDSDVDDSNGPNTTRTITLLSSETNLDIDAGLFLEAKVGNFVWVEITDGVDNVQDPTDTGLNGILMELYEVGTNILVDDQLTATNTDGIDGSYLFTGLKPGNYYIKVEMPLDTTLKFVVPNSGSDDMLDSDVIDPINGLTSNFIVNPGDCILDIDAGFRPIPLPVELLDFYGEYVADRDVNALTWITASEINNDHFEVERAFENGDFERIGKVNGNGTTSQIIKYNFDDEDISKSGTYYYRLRQVDYDGSFEYSNTISINVERAFGQDVSIYPNPAKDIVTVKVEWEEDAHVQLRILDAAGKLVKDQVIDTRLRSAVEQFNIPVFDLPKGIYLFRIDVDGAIFNKKVLVID